MGKIAFVFPGQGAQFSGMGKSLYDISENVRNLYDSAEKIRKGTIEQSFNGSEEELKITSNTQPCMYLAELASAMCLNENGIYAQGAAGFSLGEISALAHGGAFTGEDGFKIVCRRGELMNDSSSEFKTSMCAVLKLSPEKVEEISLKYDRVYPVNYNSSLQTVVSGLTDSLEKFMKEAEENGAKCIPLQVSAAFHSPFMNKAANNFSKILNEYKFDKNNIPVYSNYSSNIYSDNIRLELDKQINNPVRWRKIVENMISDGFTDFIEAGPGKVLSGLIKKISKDVFVYNVSDSETLMETVEKVKSNAAR